LNLDKWVCVKRIASERYGIDCSPRLELDLLDLLDVFIAEMRTQERYVLGFPGNLDFSFSRLAGLLDVFVNNVGDPGSSEKSDVSAKMMERAVVDFMAGLANGDPRRVLRVCSQRR
jgi:hypothetical protein